MEAFQAAENVADEQFVTDLERVMSRTRREIESLNERLATEVE